MTDSSFNYTNLTLEELRTLAASPQIGAIEAMPPAFRHLATSMGEVADLLTKAQADLPNWWKGQAADQAAAALGRAAAEAHEFHGSAISAATAIARCATIVAEQQHQMMNVPEAPEPGVTAIIDPPKTPMAALEAARQDVAYQAAREQAVQVVNGIAAQYVETREQLTAIGTARGENFEVATSDLTAAQPNSESSRKPQAEKPFSETHREPSKYGLALSNEQARNMDRMPGFVSINDHVPPSDITSSTNGTSYAAARRPTARIDTQYYKAPFPNSTAYLSGSSDALGTTYQRRNFRKDPPNSTWSGTESESLPHQSSRPLGKSTYTSSPKESQVEEGHHMTEIPVDLQQRATEGLSTDERPPPYAHEDFGVAKEDTGSLESKKRRAQGNHATPTSPVQFGMELATPSRLQSSTFYPGTEHPALPRMNSSKTDAPMVPPLGSGGSIRRQREDRGPRPAYLKEHESTWSPDAIAAPPDGILTPDWFERSQRPR